MKQIAVMDWRLAEALAIQKLHGDAGPTWITERLGALALVGDAAGIERFLAIAEAYERLLTSTRH